jgi:2-desacetyl-2-hydroxyethyl bacteriochlorophyllide A dehydrogenase
MRFEPHHFPRQHWSAIGFAPTGAPWRASLAMSETARWSAFMAAVRIDLEAALRATSHGGPQIMGFNAGPSGYAAATDMVRAMAAGAPAPMVWEVNPDRRAGAMGYRVLDPADDPRRDYRAVYDASGAPDLLNTLIGRIAKGGEVVLAGFYTKPLSFAFAPAFLREARIRIAAEWAPDDLTATRALIDSGALSLAGLITHRRAATQAPEAYETAFTDPACLKMILAWDA